MKTVDINQPGDLHSKFTFMPYKSDHVTPVLHRPAFALDFDRDAPNGIPVPGQCTREIGQLGGSSVDNNKTDMP